MAKASPKPVPMRSRESGRKKAKMIAKNHAVLKSLGAPGYKPQKK